MKKVNIIYLIFLELFCPQCYFLNFHNGHKVLQINDEKTLEKENIALEQSIKAFNDKIDKTKNLKEKIENEINKINKSYDEVYKKVTTSFLQKHEILLRNENDMKEKLQNEVTKIKEKLENFLSELNEILKINERINKGIKKIEKEEKNYIKNLSYVSKMSNIQESTIKINSELMRNLKIYFDENESNIKYEDYYFNGIPIPKNIMFKDIKLNSVNIFWEIDDIYLENKEIKFIVEIRKENSKENFYKIYEGSNKNCFIDKLNSDTSYEIKVCSMYKEIKNWSEIEKFKTDKFDSIILKESKQEKEFSKKIIEWTGCNKLELLYRGTKDGSKSEIFHKKCDNKGPTVCLYKNEKGNIFGGYASISWTSEGDGPHSAPESFIFTLRNNYEIPPTKFNNSKTDKSVYHAMRLGPAFFDDICIYNNFLDDDRNNSAYSSFPTYYNDSTGKGRKIFTGNDDKNNYFKIKEIEVFRAYK